MSAFDLSFQRMGGRLLPTLPRAWETALQGLGFDPQWLPLAEGLASFTELAGQTPASLQLTILVCLLVLAAQAEGHSGLPLEGPGRGVLERYAEAFAVTPEALLAHLDSPAMALLLGRPEERKPLLREYGILYSERVRKAEVRVAQAMQARRGPDGEPPPARDESVLASPRVLNLEQIAAVRKALAWPLTLITGGPGTGKTTIIVAILRAALRQCGPPPRVALAAPTGKAANRMAASIAEALAMLPDLNGVDQPLTGPDFIPRTLHRLLGYNPAGDTYRYHEQNPLPVDLVIIDESSMVDLAQMERLLRAVPPEAKLILLGDVDQLASVETGRVLQDLVEGMPESVARLRISLRTDPSKGQTVLAAAGKIVNHGGEGLFEPPLAIVAHDPESLEPRVDYLDGEQLNLRRFLLDWLRKEIEHAPSCPDFLQRIEHVHCLQDGVWQDQDLERLERLFRHANRVRILCPLKQDGQLRGSRPVNDFLHAQVSAVRDRKLNHPLAISLGEPLMMTRNDPRRGIYNGDQGLALLIARDGASARLEAVFPCAGGGFSCHAIGPLLNQLEVAYALTVHKSQGSEFERIAILLPKDDSPFVSREILYTALTRSKQSVTLVASRDNLEKAAKRVTVRYSGLAARLLQGQRSRSI